MIWIKPARRLRRRLKHPASRGQALVELALVMPLLAGIIAILFQFGVLFVSYLSLVHATRDIARFVAVHPDTIDGAPTPPSLSNPPCATTPPSGSLWAHVCGYDVPGVIDKNKVEDLPLVTPACTSVDASGHCAARTTGSSITINMSYDARGSIFIPMSLRWGPWMTFDVPNNLLTMTYDYTVMVEPH
jgi:Flp pilus assembly protein TadG